MKFNIKLKDTAAEFDGALLKVKAGGVSRHWRLCCQGLSTCWLTDEVTGQIFVDNPECSIPDWHIYTFTKKRIKATLVKTESCIISADDVQSEHIRIRLFFEDHIYKLSTRYEVIMYPGISGFRTQLALKSINESDDSCLPNWLTEAYSEHLSLNTNKFKRSAVGYYNDTQHRYHTDLSILKEEEFSTPIEQVEVCDWANLYVLESSDETGIVLLKESHKCVNQPGIDTGHFKIKPDSICSTGLGLKSHYADGAEFFTKDDFRTAWANWCIIYNGGEVGRQTAVKRFDRARFPFRYERDALITSNTWGSRGAGSLSRGAANEKDLLIEIERAGRIGIDCVQIDDGWQCYDNDNPASPSHGWFPSDERFSKGWAVVKQVAAENGVKLGIWFPWYAPLKDMEENISQADFKQVKIDFLNASSRKVLDEVFSKAQTITKSGEGVQVNADLTEQAPRFGYYFGRDYCSLFPQNVQMVYPDKGIIASAHISYTPHITLKQTWDFAKYMNLNKIQISTQNIAMIPELFSDAYHHSHEYCFAITMMGLPLFFLETKFYTEEAMGQLKPILKEYHKHRREIYDGIVYPIGDQPDNNSITGFQSHRAEFNSGYITVFRELNAPKASSIKALFLANKTVTFEDIYKAECYTSDIDSTGSIPVSLPSTASWQLLKYSYENK